MTYEATGSTAEGERRVSVLDFIISCATSDPNFMVEEVSPGTWEASCTGRRFRARTARLSLERLASARGVTLYEDDRGIAALCEGLAPALCLA